MSELEEFKKLLSTKKAIDVIGNDFRLIDVAAEDTVLVALKKLMQNNISSLPVYYKETKKYFGFIDMQDIAMVIFVLAVSKSFVDLFAQNVVEWHDFDNEDWKVFSTENVESFCNASERDHFKACEDQTPLVEIMKILANPSQNTDEKGKGNIRRVAVQKQGKVIGIISQFGLVQFIASELKKSNLLQKLSFNDLPNLKKQSNLHLIKESDLAIDAFKLMLENRISGVGVVDENGKLTSVVSTSDVKREKLNEELFSDLRLPAKDYLAKSQRYFKKEVDEKSLVMSGDDKVQSVLDKIVKFHLHHIFELDENKIPVNEFSLCDIISTFLP